MRSSLHSFWRAHILFGLGLLLHCGEARVLTEVQAGPLYRVVGHPLSISCNVSGFASTSSRQEFEFRVTKPSRPNVEFNIISTVDTSFPYAQYTQRVALKEITLKHVSATSVLFEIQSLDKDDEGVYDCSVINSEAAFNGIYSVQTTVKVIDNSLSLSAPTSTSLNHNEGDSLTLTCQASSNTIQHTHLSFAWYIHKSGEDDARLIISLDRDFTLSPGQAFEKRYQAGLIRLDKESKARYTLKMDQLEPSDQGRIYCHAREWIQDPDRSWYSITQKDAEGTTLNVKAREVSPDTTSLVVRILTHQTTLQEGQGLMLSCNVDSQNLERRFFSVAWLRGDVELACVGPTGVLSVGPEYSDREKVGELRAARTGDRDYRLVLKPVRMEDQGEYFCRAWPQERGQDGAFVLGAAQDSGPQLISISATESGLSVAMQSSVSVNEGDRLKLTCEVAEVKGQLSVTWQHKSTPTAAFTNIVSLSPDGVMDISEEFDNRKVRAMRPVANSFTMELDDVTPSDAGVYQCTVSEWKSNSKTNSQSKTATLAVLPIESLVKVKLISRSINPTVGDNVELMCRVKGPHVPVTLTWSLQRAASTVDNILTLKSNGDISWYGDHRGYNVKVENRPNEVIHYLSINGVSSRMTGTYQCSPSVFLENTYKKLPPSNQLSVLVQKPESQLILTSSMDLTTNINMDIEMKCSVISGAVASTRYTVIWRRQEQNKAFVSSDLDALVTFGSQVELVDRQRISIRRTKGPSFELKIRQVQVSDSGSYICEVVEWHQDPQGDWYQLSPVSNITQLKVSGPEKKLSIEMVAVDLNVSRPQTFSIPCNIIKQSSSESKFQVTWFWQKERETKRPIFTVYRNHTLQDRFGKSDALRLVHPQPNQFSLTILKPDPENSGLYFCEVEEWLPSLSHGWWKVGEEKSANFTVNINTEAEAVSQPQCKSGTWIGIFVGFVICSVLVIGLLVLKLCRGKEGGNKPGQSLWAEQPLKSKPDPDF